MLLTPALNRIEKLLVYIHRNLDLPLSLADLSKQSCWSRWQLQRVFYAKTGLNVAQYVQGNQAQIMQQSRSAVLTRTESSILLLHLDSTQNQL
ncbi:hypothetical protein P4S72_25730 [Vibrio sp. PP-XX7]